MPTIDSTTVGSRRRRRSRIAIADKYSPLRQSAAFEQIVLASRLPRLSAAPAPTSAAVTWPRVHDSKTGEQDQCPSQNQ